MESKEVKQEKKPERWTGEPGLVLFVCTGNTCRSPMAAALFNRIAQERDWSWRAVSAGMAAQTGDGATPQAVTVMAEQGIEINEHRSQPLTADLLAAAALVVLMTQGHKQRLAQLAPAYQDKLVAFGELTGADVEDPFAGSLDTYRRVAVQLSQGMEKIENFLRQMTGNYPSRVE